jgi:hypothetical protein
LPSRCLVTVHYWTVCRINLEASPVSRILYLEQQSRAEQSRSLLPAIILASGPGGTRGQYLLDVETITVFFFLWGALSDERTGLTFIYAAGPCQRKLASRLPDMKHSVQRYTYSFLRLSSKRGFLCCENSPYLAVVTETLLEALPRNRCLCNNLGDVFQQAVTWQWIYMSKYELLTVVYM